VLRVADDEREVDFWLSWMPEDDPHGLLGYRVVPDGMFSEYRARADRANQWLSRTTWRSLARCAEPAGACTVELEEPRLVVRNANGTLLDVSVPSWSADANPNCSSPFPAQVSDALCDAHSNAMLIKVSYLSPGCCPAPARQFHVVKLRTPGGCTAPAPRPGSVPSP
jgi:hypothetical protein